MVMLTSAQDQQFDPEHLGTVVIRNLAPPCSINQGVELMPLGEHGVQHCAWTHEKKVMLWYLSVVMDKLHHGSTFTLSNINLRCLQDAAKHILSWICVSVPLVSQWVVHMCHRTRATGSTMDQSLKPLHIPVGLKRWWFAEHIEQSSEVNVFYPAWEWEKPECLKMKGGEKKKDLANIWVCSFKLQETYLQNRIISAGSDSPLLSHLYSSTCRITTITKQLML